MRLFAPRRRRVDEQVRRVDSQAQQRESNVDDLAKSDDGAGSAGLGPDGGKSDPGRPAQRAALRSSDGAASSSSPDELQRERPWIACMREIIIAFMRLESSRFLKSARTTMKLGRNDVQGVPIREPNSKSRPCQRVYVNRLPAIAYFNETHRFWPGIERFGTDIKVLHIKPDCLRSSIHMVRTLGKLCAWMPE